MASSAQESALAPGKTFSLVGKAPSFSVNLGSKAIATVVTMIITLAPSGER